MAGTDRGYTPVHRQERASSPVVDTRVSRVERTTGDCGEGHCENKSSHPRSPKDMPFLDAEVLPKTFDVFHQIPGRVLLQARTPTPPVNRSVAVLK